MKYSEDIKLANQISGGNEDAIKAFFDGYLDPLYGFIYYRVDSHKEDAEDLLQESIMGAIKSMKNFKGNSSLFTWLCAISKNKIATFKFNRAKKEHMEVKMEEVDKIIEKLCLIGHEQLDEKLFKQEETKALINRVFSDLPPQYQNCLVQKYIHELPVKNIAESLGVTLKSIESMLSRAREAFKIAFKELEGV